MSRLFVLWTPNPRQIYAPAQVAGVFACPGVVTIPVVARYYADDGMPLLNVDEAAEVAGVKRKTIYEWARRGFITHRGLGDNGEYLWRADDVAAVRATPRQRQKVAA